MATMVTTPCESKQFISEISCRLENPFGTNNASGWGKIVNIIIMP